MMGPSLGLRVSCAVSTSAAAVPVVRGSIAVTAKGAHPGTKANGAANK